MALSVLLVDDTAFLRSMLREILESSGSYRVIAEASDGIAALTLQPELSPDFVVSDLIMPGLDGIEMTRALVGADPGVRIVVTAAEDQLGAALEALAAGAYDFLPKPFSREMVLQILSQRPAPPPPRGGSRVEYRIHFTLAADAPLKAARARVLLARCRQVGTVLETSPEGSHPHPPDPPEVLRIRLLSSYSQEFLRDWLGGLSEVENIVLEPLPAPEEVGDAPRRNGVGSLPGGIRLRASLLDRLLGRAESAREARARLAGILGLAPVPPETADALQALDQSLSDLQTDVLAARLVPFDRMALRLRRTVEVSARAMSRQASLVLQGGGTPLDLGTLEGIATILLRLLPRIIEAGVPRSDLLRQLGRPEAGEVRITASRAGSSLTLLCETGNPSSGTEPPEIEEEVMEQVRRLGGRIGILRQDDTWRIELVAPAGVAVVRSFLCQAGGRLFAVPVGSVERAMNLDTARIRVRQGRSVWEGEPGESIPLIRCGRAPWVEAEGASLTGFPALLYRVGPQRYALALDAVLGETDVVIRPSPGNAGSREVAGTAFLSDGGLALVPDLPHLARIG